MKMLFIFFTIFITGCSHPNKKDKSPSSEWINLNTKDSIPNQLKDVIVALNGNAKIANLNEEFEATDYITDTILPTRQLKLLSRKGDNWRLSYEQGGIVTSYVYIQGEIRNDSLFHLKIGRTSFPINNNDIISNMLKEGKLELQEMKINYK